VLLFILLLMLLLLFLPRSLLFLLLLGFTRGPTPFRKKKTFREKNVPRLRSNQSTFSSCSNDAASAPQGAAFSPSAICCATTR
jgi:hypothetical protein